MRSWGIRTRVLLLTIVPTLTISLLLGFYFISMRISDLNKNLKTRGESYITQLSSKAGYGLFLEDRAYLEELTKSVLSNMDVDFAGVYTNSGELVSYTGKQPKLSEELFSKLDYIQHNDILSYQDQKDILFVSPVILRSIILPNINNNQYFWERYLENKDKRLGWVVIRLSRVQTLTFQNQSIIATVIIVLIGLAISILFGLRLGRDVTNPLLSIINVVKRIRDGKLDSRVDINAPGEMRSLEEGINAMAKSLMNSRREMQENIEQATAELRSTLKTIELQNTELDVARNQALQASRIKSAFLANMSHEIRTPLNGIIGFTNLLLKTRLTQQQQEFVNTIKTSSKNLLDIINNILDLSKIEADKLELEDNTFDLYGTLEDVVMLIKPLALEKGIKIDVNVIGHIPDKVIGDALRLNQVLTNLLGNAIKFSQQGWIIVTLTMLKHSEGFSYFSISVQDTGIGMTPEQMNKLFEPFSQADTSTTRKYGGTGLGLAISKRIIEKMHGHMQVDSQPGEGSVFTMHFALQEAVSHSTDSEQPVCQLAHKQAMIWEAHQYGGESLQHLLEKSNVSTNIVKSEEGLIDLIADTEQSFDFVFLGLEDLSQPEKLKSSLIMDIRNFSQAQIIIMAFNYDNEVIDFAKKAQADAALSRPFRYSTLHNILIGDYDLYEDESAEGYGDESSMLQSCTEAQHACKVLAVDDNQVNLKLLTMLLKGFGAEVKQAENGQQAIDLASQTKFDLVLLDLQMPVVDGFQACQEIRQIDGYANVPIIALSADVLGDNESRMVSAGFNEFYSKPIKESDMADLFEKYNISLASQANVSADETSTDDPSDQHSGANQAASEVFIDFKQGKQLANNSEQMAKEMLDLLMQDLPETKTHLQEYFANQDLNQLQSAVHKLHGGCCYCGVPPLKQAAANLEASLKNGSNHNEISQNYYKLIDVIEKTLKAYEDLC